MVGIGRHDPPPNLPQKMRVKIVNLTEHHNGGSPVGPRPQEDINKDIAALEDQGWLVNNVSDQRIVLARPFKPLEQRVIEAEAAKDIVVPAGLQMLK